MPNDGGWLGVDLDRTLAHYTEWKGEAHLGAPIPAMVKRVRRWLEQGYDVRIFTARAIHGEPQITYIQDWCEKHIGKRLPVTATKDFQCFAIYDDIAHRVEPNTGVVIA